MDIYELLIKKLGLKDPELINSINEMVEIKKFKKNELIIAEGEVQTHFYCLLSGVFRGFLFDKNGKEITDCFGFELGDAVMSCHALGDKAKTNIEAITEVITAKISVEDLQMLLERFPEMFWLYNDLLLKALDEHWNIKEVRYRLSAAERYQWFLETYPELVKYVKGKHIASFLGMSPVSLSRLRHDLKNGSNELK